MNTGQAGQGGGRFLGKDDSCESILAIHRNYASTHASLRCLFHEEERGRNNVLGIYYEVNCERKHLK